MVLPHGRKHEIVILLRPGPNRLAGIRPGSRELARVHKRGQRSHHARMLRCHVLPLLPACGGEHSESVRELAGSVRVRLSDPVFPAARQHDENARQRRVVRRLVGDFRNVIRCWIESTSNRHHLP